jgi:hypothetical protein
MWMICVRSSDWQEQVGGGYCRPLQHHAVPDLQLHTRTTTVLLHAGKRTARSADTHEAVCQLC